jgi:hypothetical protein
MSDDLKEEIPVLALVKELTLGKRTQGKATQHKRPGVEGDFLLALFPLFPNEQDGVQLLNPPAREADDGQN